MKFFYFASILFTISLTGCEGGYYCDCDYITFSKNPQVGYNSWVETFRSSWSASEIDNDCGSYQLNQSQSKIGGQTWYSKTMIECDKVYTK